MATVRLLTERPRSSIILVQRHGPGVGDVDGDGLLDWFTTDIHVPTDATTGNRLFRNFGNRVFLESSSFSGVREAGWGWGTEMLDYDNDRDLDIVATNGF